MYHYAENDQQRGPVERESLRGLIQPTTLVWREGLPTWVAAGSLMELSDLFAPTANSLPVSTAPRPAQPPPPTATPYPYPYQQPVSADDPSGLAIGSLVCGIVGLMLMCGYGIGVIPAIIAVVLGYMARSRGAVGTNSNAGFATAGIVMGWIPIALVACMILLFVVVIVIAAIAS